MLLKLSLANYVKIVFKTCLNCKKKLMGSVERMCNSDFTVKPKLALICHLTL